MLKSSVNLILESLCKITTLERLEFHNNQISEGAGEALAHVIRRNIELKYLVLNDYSIGKGIITYNIITKCIAQELFILLC